MVRRPLVRLFLVVMMVMMVMVTAVMGRCTHGILAVFTLGLYLNGHMVNAVVVQGQPQIFLCSFRGAVCYCMEGSTGAANIQAPHMDMVDIYNPLDPE